MATGMRVGHAGGVGCTTSAPRVPRTCATWAAGVARAGVENEVGARRPGWHWRRMDTASMPTTGSAPAASRQAARANWPMTPRPSTTADRPSV